MSDTYTIQETLSLVKYQGDRPLFKLGQAAVTASDR